MPSCAEMLMADMRHMRSAKATDVAAAKTAAKAADVTSTEAAAHVSAAEATTHMAAAAATTAACLRTGG